MKSVVRLKKQGCIFAHVEAWNINTETQLYTTKLQMSQLQDTIEDFYPQPRERHYL